jgi:hypothetical protein
MAHRTTLVTRREEAGQPARSWRAATQGLPPGLVVVAAVAVIVVLVPVLVTIAQAFGGEPTAAFSSIKATSATTLLLHTSLLTAPAGAPSRSPENRGSRTDQPCRSTPRAWRRRWSAPYRRARWQWCCSQPDSYSRAYSSADVHGNTALSDASDLKVYVHVPWAL